MSARNGTPAAFGAVLPAASYGVQPAPVVYSAAPTPVGTEPPAKVAGIVDGEAVVIPVAVPAAVSPIAAPPVADTQVTATTLSATAAPLPAARPIAAIKALATTKQYEVRLSDMRLSTAFARWAMDDGVRIRWEADKHLLIDAPMAFEAKDAAQAVAMALATPGISSGAYPLEVCEYPNTPPLLRVTRRGEQTKECPFLNN